MIVSGVSFDLHPGDAIVVRGANGSGKTTLLRAIAGFARIREGELTATLEDAECPLEELHDSHCHFMGHENGASGKLTVLENLGFWQEFLAGHTADSKSDILRRVGFEELQHARVAKLSAGQKRRLALARLLIAPRAIWLLDEPATALDTEGQQLMQSCCAEHRARGGVIILTTHGTFTLPQAKGLSLSAAIEEAV